MTHSLPYDNPGDGDADYPLPTDAPPETDGGVAPVPAPERPTAPATLAIPRARRELKSHAKALQSAMETLKTRQLGETADLDPLAIDALVCGASDSQLPLNDDNAHIDRLRERARRGDLDAYAGLAMDELEDALAALEAALAALKAISLLDEPVPADWGNLPPLQLARKLNVLGHTLLRGRIAGVNL